MNNSWDMTDLWVELEKRNGASAENAKTVLKAQLSKIETILRSAGTSSLDFTLLFERPLFLGKSRITLWKALPERDESFLPSFFKLLSSHSDHQLIKSIEIFSQTYSQEVLFTFSEAGVSEKTSSREPLIPVPGDDWCIKLGNDE